MAAESSSLLRWSETSLSRRTQTRTIVKVISKPVWNRGERVISTNTIPMAVETGSAQERPLSWHIKTSLLGAKQKQTLPPFQRGIEAQIMRQCTRQTMFHEQTITQRPPWGHLNSSPRQRFFVVFTQPCLILALLKNLASCFHFAFLCSLRYVHLKVLYACFCFLIF